MGMIACYTMINDADLAKLKSAEPEEMSDLLEEFNDTHEVLDIDKIWDGLHFLLTGESASNPIEGDPISEAIVGVSNLNEDDFIASTSHEELNDIVESLNAIDFAKLKTTFEPSAFDKAEIYPNIWIDNDKDKLFAELEEAFNDLLVFYKQTILERMNIVVSIY